MTRAVEPGRDAPARILRFNKCKPAQGCRGARSVGDWPR